MVILKIRKLSSVSDYLIICSAESERQVTTIASNVEQGLKRLKQRALGIEGAAYGHWVLMDYGDVVVHIFLDNMRELYDLEGLWVEAERVEWE